MIRDLQVEELMTRLAEGKPLYLCAVQSGMGEKAARKYRRLGKLPSQCLPERTWRTRRDNLF